MLWCNLRNNLLHLSTKRHARSTVDVYGTWPQILEDLQRSSRNGCGLYTSTVAQRAMKSQPCLQPRVYDHPLPDAFIIHRLGRSTSQSVCSHWDTDRDDVLMTVSSQMGSFARTLELKRDTMDSVKRGVSPLDYPGFTNDSSYVIHHVRNMLQHTQK